MKKILTLAFFASSVACLAGCAGNQGGGLPDLEGQKFIVAYKNSPYSAINSYLEEIEFVKKEDGSKYLSLNLSEEHPESLESTKFDYSLVEKNGVEMELSTHGSSGKKVQVDYGSYTVKDEKKTSNSYIKNLNVVVAGDHLYKISGTLSINASDFKLETVCYQKLDKEYNVSFDTLISQEYSVVSAVDSPSYSLKRATCVSTVKFFQDSQNNDAYLLKYSLENSPTVFDSAVSYKLIKAKYNDPEYTKENYSILYLAAKEQGVFINISDKGFGYFHTISTGISELRYFTVKA